MELVGKVGCFDFDLEVGDRERFVLVSGIKGGSEDNGEFTDSGCWRIENDGGVGESVTEGRTEDSFDGALEVGLVLRVNGRNFPNFNTIHENTCDFVIP